MLPGITPALAGAPGIVAAIGNDAYTKLLLHGEGFNGSAVIADSSIFANKGNASIVTTGQVSTAQKQFGSASIQASGGGYCTFPHDPDWELGSNNFTIDWWQYRTSLTAGPAIARDSAATTYNPWMLAYCSGANELAVGSTSGGAWDFIPSGATFGAAVLNSWQHLAIVRNGNNLLLFRNGVLTYSGSVTTAPMANTSTLAIGAVPAYGYFAGYLDEVRFSKGIARWTGNFAVPTVPYGPDYDRSTKLLLHFDGLNGGTTIIDSGPSRKAMLVNGAFKTSTAQAKFGTASALTSGSSDAVYVSAPSGDPDFAFGSGDFTIEAQLYPTSATLGYLYDGRNAQGIIPAIWVDAASKMVLFVNSAIRLQGAIALTLNAWNHVALVRSGGVTKFYINGIADGSYADANIYVNGTVNRPFLCNDAIAAANPFKGYVDELRVSNVARWTANFAPPTAPYANAVSAYTSLLGVAPTLTGIPSNAKLVLSSMSGMGMSAVDTYRFRMGPPNVAVAGYDTFTEGYQQENNAAGWVASTVGIDSAFGWTGNAGDIFNGQWIATLVDPATNTWVSQGTKQTRAGAFSDGFTTSVALTGPLDRLQFSSVGGSAVYNSGAASYVTIDGMTQSALVDLTVTQLLTGIPAGAKLVVVNLLGLKKTPPEGIRFQLGPSSGVATSGYWSGALNFTVTQVLLFGSGAGIETTVINNAGTWSGQLILTLADAATNTWVATLRIGYQGFYQMGVCGWCSISGPLERIQLSTMGTAAFASGKASWIAK